MRPTCWMARRIGPANRAVSIASAKYSNDIVAMPGYPGAKFLPDGAPDNGYEGVRFLGYPVYEGLVLWDLKSADKLADIRPGLAERWEQDPNDKAKWVFHLRKGVNFHDGSEFNADAAIWNLDHHYKKDAEQFDPPGAAVAQARNPFVAGYRKIDDYRIELTTPRPLP